ncbi:hypothetical protein, partial [[Clostridium] innocuum]|uniref:hypothetical protein n=1 Tax=Clostridium innocuum TaxID=1522 RepID=UPI001C23296C
MEDAELLKEIKIFLYKRIKMVEVDVGIFYNKDAKSKDRKVKRKGRLSKFFRGFRQKFGGQLWG